MCFYRQAKWLSSCAIVWFTRAECVSGEEWMQRGSSCDHSSQWKWENYFKWAKMEYFRWATKRQLMIHNKNENIYYHCDCQCGAICFLWLFLFGVVAFFFLFVLIYYMTWLFVAAQIRWMLWMEPHECVNLCLASVHGAPRSLGFFSISHVQIKGPRKTGLIALTICPIHFLRLILILIKFFFVVRFGAFNFCAMRTMR